MKSCSDDVLSEIRTFSTRLFQLLDEREHVHQRTRRSGVLIDASESPVSVQHSQSGAVEAASARFDVQRSRQRTVPEYSASFQVKFSFVIGFYGNLTFTSSPSYFELKPKPEQMEQHFYGAV